MIRKLKVFCRLRNDISRASYSGGFQGQKLPILLKTQYWFKTKVHDLKNSSPKKKHPGYPLITSILNPHILNLNIIGIIQAFHENVQIFLERKCSWSFPILCNRLRKLWYWGKTTFVQFLNISHWKQYQCFFNSKFWLIKGLFHELMNFLRSV